MKKISNEVKVGAIAFFTIVAFIWLYSFLKGKNIFNPSATYYVVYKEIGGLTETNPVQINGYKAGVVHAIEFINDKTGRLLVQLSIKRNFILPVGTVAEVTTASLIAGMKIRLVFGNGPGVYKSGDTIPGRLAESIITKFENELDPLKEKITGLINSLDTVLTGINNIMSPSFRANMRGTMANLDSTTKNMNELVGARDSGLKSAVADLSKFSKMLSENSTRLGKTIGNLQTISDTLAAADLYKTVMNLKTTLEKTSSILSGINEGKGTAGKFIMNDSLYTNLNNSVRSLDLLLKDLKENPKRYVQVSVFGKKSEPSK
ncbi:MAG: MlaD family protein [Bacteroidales bacterium]|jgi:phospholipid/cholesterol/gamma-HCH transport system substrate-binding protein